MNGAPRQPLHADTPRSDAPVLLTAFLALQDIDEDMGPTTFLPGTHADAEAHAALSSPTEKAKLLSQGRRLGDMPEGAPHGFAYENIGILGPMSQNPIVFAHFLKVPWKLHRIMYFDHKIKKTC